MNLGLQLIYYDITTGCGPPIISWFNQFVISTINPIEFSHFFHEFRSTRARLGAPFAICIVSLLTSINGHAGQEPIDWRYRFHIFQAYFSGLNFSEYPHSSYGQTYGTVLTQLQSIGSCFIPIDSINSSKKMMTSNITITHRIHVCYIW